MKTVKLDSHASTKTALMGNGLPRGVMMRQILCGNNLLMMVAEMRFRKKRGAGVESVGHMLICIKSWRACTNRAASQWCNLRAHTRGHYDAERLRIANSIRHLSMW